MDCMACSPTCLGTPVEWVTLLDFPPHPNTLFCSLIAGLDADQADQRAAIMAQAPLHLDSLGISHISCHRSIYKAD